MSRRAIKAINWTALAERIPDAEKPLFAAFKSRSEVFLRRMNDYPESAPKIDWDYYKKNISAAAFVDNFKKQYESLSLPFPADKYTADIEAEMKQEEARIQEFWKEADTAIVDLRAQIEKINNTLPPNIMTVEEYWQANPELATNADQPSAWPHTPEEQPDHPNHFVESDH